MTWPGRAVLQVPVPALEAPVQARYRRDDPSLLGIRPDHVHAHVTVLGPVPHPLPELTHRTLAAAFARVEPFGYVLDEVATFGNGIVHVLPVPTGPFAALTDAARVALPGVEPYEGRYRPTPHVTVDALGPGVTEDGVRAELAGVLPCRGTASMVELVWYRAGETRVLRRYPLGAGGSDSVSPGA